MSILGDPILALDPASTFIGWAKLDCDEDGPIYITSGVEKVPEAPPDERVVMVGQIVRGILDRCGCISTAVIEIPDFIAVRAKPHIIHYFRAVGVAEFVIHDREIPIDRVPASDGNHSDPKIARRKQFHDIAKRYATTDDESDAFCIGWDHLVKYYQSFLAAKEQLEAAADAMEFEEYGCEQGE